MYHTPEDNGLKIYLNYIVHVHELVLIIIYSLQVTCLQFCDDRIVSGSDDTTLKIWSAITGQVHDCTCTVHQRIAIYCLCKRRITFKPSEPFVVCSTINFGVCSLYMYTNQFCKIAKKIMFL